MTAVALPVRPTARRGMTTAQWGVLMVIATEAMVFVILLSGYFFLRAASKEWPPPGVEPPKLALAWPFTLVLWGSSVPVFWADAAVKRGHDLQVRAGLALSWVMGASFLAYTVYDFNELHFGWRDHAYGSAFYTIVGLHSLHLVVGLAMGLVVQAKAWTNRYSPHGHASMQVFSYYWHFVDLVWVAVFPSLFLSAHIH